MRDVSLLRRELFLPFSAWRVCLKRQDLHEFVELDENQKQ